jgi:hypothetical protein
VGEELAAGAKAKEDAKLEELRDLEAKKAVAIERAQRLKNSFGQLACNLAQITNMYAGIAVGAEDRASQVLALSKLEATYEDDVADRKQMHQSKHHAAKLARDEAEITKLRPVPPRGYAKEAQEQVTKAQTDINQYMDGKEIMFEGGSAVIDVYPQNRIFIAGVAEKFKDAPLVSLHMHEEQDDGDDASLALERMNAVKGALKDKHGVDLSRITTTAAVSNIRL